MTRPSNQTFWVTRDGDGAVTVHDRPPAPVLERTRLSVAGPFLTATPKSAMPPDEFAAWVKRLETLGFVVMSNRSADPPV